MELKVWNVRSSHGIKARVIADSVNPDGERLTTLEVVFNRWILAEVNTHRLLSRNSASSRAIPVKRIMDQVRRDPSVPVTWGANQAGMQARANLTGWRLILARRVFLLARFPALFFVWVLVKLSLHKQIVNRILEPWMWHTAVISATDWENFFKLRMHPDAQPEFQELAGCMYDAMKRSTPGQLQWGEWHLPYTTQAERDCVNDLSQRLSRELYHDLKISEDPPRESLISAACCARVSYVRQNDRKGVEEDLSFAGRLASSGHFSPFEHPARAERGTFGNFRGWKQLRKFYSGEDGRDAIPSVI